MAADIRREWNRRDLAWQRIEWADRPVNPADDPRDQDPDMPKPWQDENQHEGGGADGVA